jgi:hypothetical protein
MTYVSVDRSKVTTTERESILSAGEFRATITWKVFDDDPEEVDSVYIYSESRKDKDFSLHKKYPRDIVMLRDLLSAVLVELRVEVPDDIQE